MYFLLYCSLFLAIVQHKSYYNRLYFLLQFSEFSVIETKLYFLLNSSEFPSAIALYFLLLSNVFSAFSQAFSANVQCISQLSPGRNEAQSQGICWPIETLITQDGTSNSAREKTVQNSAAAFCCVQQLIFLWKLPCI